jgi:uncharacterized protein with GYD domain
MSLYMTEFAYSDEAWPSLLERPERLATRLVDVLERQLGGRLVLLAFCFGLGEYDGVLIYEAPDDATATAVLVAALTSSRHVTASKTRKLLSAAEFTAALTMAHGVSGGGPPARP